MNNGQGTSCPPAPANLPIDTVVRAKSPLNVRVHVEAPNQEYAISLARVLAGRAGMAFGPVRVAAPLGVCGPKGQPVWIVLFQAMRASAMGGWTDRTRLEQFGRWRDRTRLEQFGRGGRGGRPADRPSKKEVMLNVLERLQANRCRVLVAAPTLEEAKVLAAEVGKENGVEVLGEVGVKSTGLRDDATGLPIWVCLLHVQAAGSAVGSIHGPQDGSRFGASDSDCLKYTHSIVLLSGGEWKPGHFEVGVYSETGNYFVRTYVPVKLSLSDKKKKNCAGKWAEKRAREWGYDTQGIAKTEFLWYGVPPIAYEDDGARIVVVDIWVTKSSVEEVEERLAKLEETKDIAAPTATSDQAMTAWTFRKRRPIFPAPEEVKSASPMTPLDRLRAQGAQPVDEEAPPTDDGSASGGLEPPPPADDSGVPWWEEASEFYDPYAEAWSPGGAVSPTGPMAPLGPAAMPGYGPPQGGRRGAKPPRWMVEQGYYPEWQPTGGFPSSGGPYANPQGPTWPQGPGQQWAQQQGGGGQAAWDQGGTYNMPTSLYYQQEGYWPDVDQYQGVLRQRGGMFGGYKPVIRAKTADVPYHWRNGQHTTGSALSTDGDRLYSYALLIGETLPDGTKVVYDYTGANKVSPTTSKHVAYAKRAADKVVAPR